MFLTMFALRRFLSCSLLVLLATFAGCTMFSGDAWQRPSPFNAPPPREPENHELAGGFTVLVDMPGQPTAARVFADIGAFAQQRGFVRQSAAPPANVDPAHPSPAKYVQGKIMLDVTYDATHLRVMASLHGFSHELNHKFIDGFYGDFHQQYVGHYGDEDVIVESDYSDEPNGTPGARTRGGGGGRH